MPGNSRRFINDSIATRLAIGAATLCLGRVSIGAHAQSGATFFQLAYVATVGQAGEPVTIPNYRTTDRELSPMVGLTFGGGSRLALTSESSKPSLAIVVSGDVMYNKYFQSLFILSRTAVWGTVGVDAEF